MLKGEELAAALRSAMERKGVRNIDLSREFNVKPSTVSKDWRKLGRIGKHHIDHLVSFFADTVPPSHWGLSDWGAQVQEDRANYITVRVPREKWEQFELFLRTEQEAGPTPETDAERSSGGNASPKRTNQA